MIKSVLDKWCQNTYFIGIDFEFITKDELRVTLCVLKRRAKELKQVHTSVFDSYLSLFDALKAYGNIPIYLNIRGEGIIQHCSVDAKAPAYTKELLQSLYRIEDVQLSAFAREALVSSVIDKFKAEKRLVLGVHIGVNIAPILSIIETARIHFNKSLLKIDDLQVEYLNHIAHGEKMRNFIQTTDDVLSVAEACSFSSALSAVSNENSNIQGLAVLEQNAKEFLYQRRYKMLLHTSLIFLLTLLLGNYLAFNHYFSENSILKEKIAISETELAAVAQKKAELQSKKQFVVLNGLDMSSQLAFYADQLALLLPVDTYLEFLNLCPKETSRRDKEIRFDKTQIHLSGTTRNTKNINAYIAQIEKLDWVTEVAIESIIPKHPKQWEFSLILKLETS